MASSIRIHIDSIVPFVSKKEIEHFQNKIDIYHKAIRERKAVGKEFLGWANLPSSTKELLIKKIEAEAKRLQKLSKICVIVGIGGSYLGARAVIEALSDPFSANVPQKFPQIIYAGHTLSEDYYASLVNLLNRYDYSIVVISKSGTTTEPAVAFRLLKNHIEKKYGKKKAAQRIVAITDKSKGALRKLAEKEGYSTFTIPDDVGGRYSVLTPVGLLPIAVAGFNIRKLLQGALVIEKINNSTSAIDKNPCALYAAARNALYNKGKIIELMATYQPNLFYLTEWWKQLFGESEGKQGKGIFPAGVNFTTDLHSLGQYIQEGLRTIFETVLFIEKPSSNIKVPFIKEDLDQLNYIAGKSLQFINKMAQKGTTKAHVDGKVPNIVIEIPQLNEFTLGQLIYFYEMSCALSGYLLGVNPFDQPGVEAYKKNMFKLLGKK